MILKTVRIENYKCIEDSSEFTVGPVTCLVGKNESGKSTILQALYKLNPVESEKNNYLYLEEYPRRSLIDYEERHATNPANVLTTEWELEQAQIDDVVKAFGLGSIEDPKVKLIKGYDNKTIWTITLDHKKIIEYCLSKIELDAEEVANAQRFTTIKALINHLEAIESRTTQQANLFLYLTEKFPSRSAEESVINVLKPHLPKFIYFADYQKMPGQIALTNFIQRKNQNQLNFSDKIFLALLNLAGTTPETFSDADKFEHLKARLEGVSNRITGEIFDYWSQNKHLEVEFTFDAARSKDEPPFNSGFIFRTRIKNLRHRVTVGFDERSSGFIWFFSFLVWFSQLQKNYGNNLLILLDEPGLNLHAKAQADLLRFINEKLKLGYQVIYTTHSPFMVDSNNIMDVRTVEDASSTEGKVLGTKVGDQVLSTDSDTVFPLQAALGYDLTQTLFVGKHTLLVEGPSDLLYLKFFSEQLKKQSRECLDARWIISPSGGIDKIGSFVALFGGNKLHVAVLTDFAKGDKRKITNLRESNLLKGGHVFTADMYLNQDEADVEDLLGRELYVRLVNKCYDLPANICCPSEKPTDAPARVVKEVEMHFATLPPEIPKFDHYSPSVYLIEHSAEFEGEQPDVKVALEIFEKLFKDLNKLLSK